MGLPAQIQRQIDEADATLKQLSGQPTDAPATDTPADAPAADQTDTQPVTQDTPAAPVAETPKNDEFALLEQRYRSLQGMWQSAEARLRKSQEQVEDLTAKLQDAVSKLEAAAKPAQQTKQGPLVTDKDAEAFGTDLIDLARRVATEQFGEREQKLLDHITRLEAALQAQSQKLGDVTQTQAQTAQERFYTALDSALPQWEQVQSTVQCQEWLASKIPGTPYTWNQALVSAAQEHDSARALEVFNAFLAANPGLDPRKKADPVSKKTDVMRQVAPSKSSAAIAAPASKKVYSSAEWQSSMNQVARMSKARQYAEAEALEAELNAALAEGRVTP